MKHILLNDGHKIPTIGYGTYKSNGGEGVKSVVKALSKGYRLVDTAAAYNNEESVGKGIQVSGIDRSELFITTKLWRENLGYNSAKQELEISLSKLGLDYIDLYLIHWPANARNYHNWREINAETWRAMEELQKDGKIKSIGVSNFWQEHLEALFQTAKVIPAVNQIEFHPGYWQQKLVEFCSKQHIVIEAWSPLARGRVFDNKLLQDIALNHQRSVAQICLRWVIQHNVVVIPKSSVEERMKDNFEIFNFELTAQEMKLINNLPEMGFSGELPNLWPERI